MSASYLYNGTYATLAPGAITQTGNCYIFGTAATLTLTADNLSKTYGSANPTLTYTPSGLVGTDTLANALQGSPTLTTAAGVGSPVGSYAINVGAGTTASDLNYNLVYTAGTLSVGQKTLTLTADNQSRQLGAANPALTYSYNGLYSGDSISALTPPVLSTVAGLSSGIGTYTISLNGAAYPNYNIQYVNGVLTVLGDPTVPGALRQFTDQNVGNLPESFLGSNPFPTLDQRLVEPPAFDSNEINQFSYRIHSDFGGRANEIRAKTLNLRDDQDLRTIEDESNQEPEANRILKRWYQKIFGE